MAKKKKEEEKGPSLGDQFKQALPMFLPLIAGGLMGGLDTGIAAQEGANKAFSDQQKAEMDAQKFGLEQEKLDKDVELRQRELDLKERALEQDRGIAAMKLGAMKKKPLSTEAAKSLGHVQMGQAALADMQNAIDAGVNKFSLVGDNEFTFAQSRFAEALGRMQSGGAINKDEQARFESMAPTSFDSAEIVKEKMRVLNEEMARRFENITGEPSQLQQVNKQADGIKELADSLTIEQLQAEMDKRKGIK